MKLFRQIVIQCMFEENFSETWLQPHVTRGYPQLRSYPRV